MERSASDGSPVTPNPEKTCLNTGRDPALDVLNLAKTNVDSHFKFSEWTFNEINELKIKNWALQSKLEELGAKIVAIEKKEVDRGDHGLNKETRYHVDNNKKIKIEVESMRDTIKIVARKNN